MNQEQKKVKKRVIGLFLIYLCIALVCFGVCAYLIITYRGTESVSDRIVDGAKILALVGIFFLVVDFGYLLPVLIKKKKVNTNRSMTDSNAGGRTSDIFDEANMRLILEKYIPNGETLLAGIHAISKETSVTGVYGKCVRTANGFRPDENGSTVSLLKKKYSAYDIYLGITQYSLIVTQCEKNSYYYQFDDVPNISEAEIQEVTADILFDDIGTCFLLSDIQSCEIKNGWMGSVNCFIKMKNGSYFKLMLPKLGGLGEGMPHHTEYRQAIIARLGEHIE